MKLNKNLLASVACGALIGLATTSVAQADIFKRLEELTATHKTVRAANADFLAADERLQETNGVWYPNLNVTGSIGREDQINSEADNTLLTPRQLDLTVTQRLYDFGSNDATIKQSELRKRASDANKKVAVQDILLQGIIAHLNLLRASEVADFALRSEENILAQEKLEADRLAAGGGQETDLLQVRSQLSAARARRIQAEGDVQIARNLFKKVYGFFPEVEFLREVPAVERQRLPENVDAAVVRAIDGNLRIQAARLGTEALLEASKQNKADKLYPKLNAIAQVTAKQDVSGTEGYERDAIAKIEVSFPFNLGMTALNSIRASELDHTSGTFRLDQARDEIEELVRNAWQNFRTAQNTSDLLRDQAQLAADFLELAREERKLGNRSLLDVLAGETALLNARADATAARRNFAINAFTLLSLVSDLTLEQMTINDYGGPLRLPN